MKVKDLKLYLDKCNDDYDVVVCDVKCYCLEVLDVMQTAPIVYLEVRQDFPEEWYREGQEVRWIDGNAVILSNNVEKATIEVTNPAIFGDKAEHNCSFEFRDGEAIGDGIRLTYPKLEDLCDGQIEIINEYVGGRIADSGCITPYDVALKYGKLELIGVMDGTNGHDTELVKRINGAWVPLKSRFMPILCALYERDIDEITDADSFQIADWFSWPEYKQGLHGQGWGAYTQRALAEMKAHWDVYAENYLQHIADNGDLECILNFIGESISFK